MLQEWLKKNVRSDFDMDVYEKKKELMINTYGAIRAIRILLMGHPLAKGVDIPDYLLQGKDIVFY